jgi:hypothetical protein
MALDPRISLAAQVPDISNLFTNFRDSLERSKAIERNDAAAPFQQQLLEQQAASGAAQATDERSQRRLSNLYQTGQQLKPFLDRGDTQGAQNFMLNNISRLQSRIEAGEDIDITESMETLQKLQQGDVQGVQGDIAAVNGLFNQQAGRGQTASQREMQGNLRIAQDPNSTQLEKDSALRALGAKGNISASATVQIAQDAALGQQVANQKAAESQAAESGKSKAQLKFEPRIKRAVKLAEKEATERGDVLTDLAVMEASLPGVKEVVEELLELSDIATSTLGGKAFDFVVKQSGFGATKGADAKAKIRAIVDNQVLPLLKETFGAAFTAVEGESLKASLVDPDASPSQKRLQLESFLAQKERNVRTKQNQLETEVQPTGAGINEFSGFRVIR